MSPFSFYLLLLLSAKACEVSVEKDPQCGSDGKTYSNKSEAACAKIEILHAGACEKYSIETSSEDANGEVEKVAVIDAQKKDQDVLMKKEAATAPQELKVKLEEKEKPKTMEKNWKKDAPVPTTEEKKVKLAASEEKAKPAAPQKAKEETSQTSGKQSKSKLIELDKKTFQLIKEKKLLPVMPPKQEVEEKDEGPNIIFEGEPIIINNLPPLIIKAPEAPSIPAPKQVTGIFNKEFCQTTPEKDPICSFSKKTYINFSQFKCQEDSVVYYRGVCRPVSVLQCNCPKIWKPVCSTDNFTFSNLCHLACAKADLMHYGSCNGVPEYCDCDQIEGPVCGIDGSTYQNKCILKCLKIEFLYNGVCKSLKKECECSEGYSPVCGKNGFTYSNLCWMSCDKAEMEHFGPC